MTKQEVVRNFSLGIFGILLLFCLLNGFIFFVSAAPSGPSSIVFSSNETKTPTSALEINISGGYIATINITASVQNLRWKAFVGMLTGQFVLQDSNGSNIYDWSFASVGGEVYATRNSTTVSWTNIRCVNVSLLELENTAMSHTNSYDNITKTFNGTTHSSFFVGSVNITQNSCPTLNTYKNSSSQDTDFEEVALTDSTNFTAGGKIIYSTILEQQVSGFDNNPYDFQMIVPENGAPSFTGATPYYLYVELN